MGGEPFRFGSSAVDELEWEVEPGVAPLLSEYAEPNLFFLGDGQGGFVDASSQAGRLTSVAEVSRGLVPGDLDRDGDLDLVVVNCGSAGRVFRNDMPRLGNWLAVRAIEQPAGRAALGATVSVVAGGRTRSRPLIANSSFLTATEPEAHFGLGQVERFDSLEVVWPDGSRETFPGGPVDRSVKVRKGAGQSS